MMHVMYILVDENNGDIITACECFERLLNVGNARVYTEHKNHNCHFHQLSFRTRNGSPSATNVFLLVLVNFRFSITYNFSNTQLITIKLHSDICDHIPHEITVLNF